MLQFLMVAAVMFGLCWVWVGGYLADFVIWVISKVTPNSTNEQGLAYVVGAVFLALGIIAALATRNGSVGPTLGGAIAGAGLYIAVRLPGKIRNNRLRRLANGAASELSDSPSPTEAFGPAEPRVPAETHPGGDASSQRDEAWGEVHDPSTSSARLAQIAALHPEFASAIVAHPNCYPELAAWARASGLLDSAPGAGG